MCVYIYIYIYMYIHMYDVCMYVCMYVCTYVCGYACMYVCTLCMYIYVYSYDVSKIYISEQSVQKFHSHNCGKNFSTSSSAIPLRSSISDHGVFNGRDDC